MTSPRSRDLLLYGLALVAVLVLGVRWLAAEPDAGGEAAEPPIAFDEAGAAVGADPSASSGAEASGAGAPASSGAAGTLVIHVAGAVRRPGVYRLQPGSRVEDALRLAGGARPKADLAALNLAAKVADGQQILVARIGARAPAPAATGAATAAPADGPIDLNTATLEQLDTLDGIGPATAQKILDAREAKGGFRSVEELGEVPGIGEKRLATLRERVRV